MSEKRIITGHVFTVLVGQLAVMAYGVTDTIVAGFYSVDALAALSVAASIFITVYITLLAAIQGLLPVWAELKGAQKSGAIGASVRQCLYLALIFTLVGMALLLLAPRLFGWLGIPQTIHEDVSQYLAILAAALPAAMFYRVFVTLSQAIGIPQMATVLQIVGLGVKIPLSIWFVHGGWGLPALGVEGCAWATLVVNYCLIFMAVGLTLRQGAYQALQLYKRLERPDWQRQRAFLRLAIPSGLIAGVEVSSFALMALLIARQGSVASSAHQIAGNLAAVCYMFPLSLAIVCSARVSYWRGAGNELQAQRLAKASVLATFIVTSGLAFMLVLLRDVVVSLYSGDSAVQQIAASLLLLVAIYHIADGVQVVACFLLRCYRVTIAPMFVYPAMLWTFGIGGGYLFAYHGLASLPAAHAPWPFWAAACVGLGLTAAAMLFLLWRVMRAALPTKLATA